MSILKVFAIPFTIIVDSVMAISYLAASLFTSSEKLDKEEDNYD